jgi:hypothetical protein
MKALPAGGAFFWLADARLRAIFALMFRTELTIAPAAGQLARTARVLTMGSCFADSIGARLMANKVEARVNPFGTVFQPLALARLLRGGGRGSGRQHVQAHVAGRPLTCTAAGGSRQRLQCNQGVVRRGRFSNTDLVL